MGDVEEQQDWLGINLQAIINQELDRIEQRNGEGFTPTFERDLAHRVISLGFALFSARGNTIGGTMLACELQKAVSGDALTALQARLGAVEGERDAAREGLANIESGACIEEWSHKPEGQFQDYAAAILRGESPPVWETCPSCDGIGRDPTGLSDCAVCHGDHRVIKGTDHG